ncbi:hypothetical protein [Saccharibacillus kuerlensis]|uniref:Uncharacterized protein n=1 Tax=Saccharibacillus kuerlensis TaxID=459527 RepID=A0ABQ2L9E3_9BACL|nr:hypothetical protein [Saccharibacillus kuerlensis]GGO07527.1 hypothetical protein GCM10010969_36030 [Saccharibacillus kuerlensis]
MHQYMVPNSRDEGITGIQTVGIHGEWTDGDLKVVEAIFERCVQNGPDGLLEIELSGESKQRIRLFPADSYRMEITLAADNSEHDRKRIEMPNVILNVKMEKKGLDL